MVANIIVMVILDLWMIANLLYYRSYFSAIPLSSYLLVGNLVDFLPSVTSSFRWCDALFPISTIAFTFFMFRRTHQSKIIFPYGRWPYFILLISLFTLLAVCLSARGGFLTEYRNLLSSSYRHSSGPPLYTLFGKLYFDYADEQLGLTKEQECEINNWLSERPVLVPIPDIESRDNCIFILAESLESWVLNLTVENQEITPYLNKLVKDSCTLYAPNVLTQVNGGRSIDAQLLLLAGLLPLQSGVYSCRFPSNTYYTLPKAMKELKGTRNYLFTVDKTQTWNQEAVAQGFGIDTIISHHDFEMAETFGYRKRLGDRPFFSQCKEMMENGGGIWPPGEHVFIQMVTVSGHSPFKMPESLKSVHFSDKVPEVMADYMSLAHYTDEAIGKFVEYLKTRPEYERTMVVITGDHEGLADNRKGLCNSEGGKGIVSEKEFTPLIILNSPVAMCYTKVMGQVDVYTTLLNLLGLEHYRWSGIGQSILDPEKPGVAIGPKRNIEGDTMSLSHEELLWLQRSPIMSDRIIRADKLKDF